MEQPRCNLTLPLRRRIHHDEHADEPRSGGQLPLRAQLFDLIGSMRVTQLIYVAAKLGIADQLTEGPKRIDELAATAAVDTTALYRVLRALASHGIFAETGDCYFALTPAELLREDAAVRGLARPARVGDAAGGREPLETAGALLECVQTGETAFHQVFGMGHWEYGCASDTAETFNRMSASNTEAVPRPSWRPTTFRPRPRSSTGWPGPLAAILVSTPPSQAC